MVGTKSISISEKLAILERYEKEELHKLKKKEAAKILGVHRMTLERWIWNKSLLQNVSEEKTRTRLRRCKREDVALPLLNWYKERTKAGYYISRKDIVNKGNEISKALKKGKFIASDGWITRWKHRHGLIEKCEETKTHSMVLRPKKAVEE